MRLATLEKRLVEIEKRLSALEHRAWGTRSSKPISKEELEKRWKAASGIISKAKAEKWLKAIEADRRAWK